MLCRIARVIATHPTGTSRDGSNRTVDPPNAAPRLANRRSASSRVAVSRSPSCTRAALDVDVASSASSSLAITRNRAPRRASSARAPVASSYRTRSPKLTNRSLAVGFSSSRARRETPAVSVFGPRGSLKFTIAGNRRRRRDDAMRSDDYNRVAASARGASTDAEARHGINPRRSCRPTIAAHDFA